MSASSSTFTPFASIEFDKLEDLQWINSPENLKAMSQEQIIKFINLLLRHPSAIALKQLTDLTSEIVDIIIQLKKEGMIAPEPRVEDELFDNLGLEKTTHVSTSSTSTISSVLQESKQIARSRKDIEAMSKQQKIDFFRSLLQSPDPSKLITWGSDLPHGYEACLIALYIEEGHIPALMWDDLEKILKNSNIAIPTTSCWLSKSSRFNAAYPPKFSFDHIIKPNGTSIQLTPLTDYLLNKIQVLSISPDHQWLVLVHKQYRNYGGEETIYLCEKKGSLYIVRDTLFFEHAYDDSMAPYYAKWTKVVTVSNYVLAYNSERQVQAFSIDFIAKKLVDEGYISELQHVEYIPSFPGNKVILDKSQHGSTTVPLKFDWPSMNYEPRELKHISFGESRGNFSNSCFNDRQLPSEPAILFSSGVNIWGYNYWTNDCYLIKNVALHLLNLNAEDSYAQDICKANNGQSIADHFVSNIDEAFSVTEMRASRYSKGQPVLNVKWSMGSFQTDGDELDKLNLPTPYSWHLNNMKMQSAARFAHEIYQVSGMANAVIGICVSYCLDEWQIICSPQQQLDYYSNVPVVDEIQCLRSEQEHRFSIFHQSRTQKEYKQWMDHNQIAEGAIETLEAQVSRRNTLINNILTDWKLCLGYEDFAELNEKFPHALVNKLVSDIEQHVVNSPYDCGYSVVNRVNLFFNHSDRRTYENKQWKMNLLHDSMRNKNESKLELTLSKMRKGRG